MKQHTKNEGRYFSPLWTMTFFFIALSVIAVATSAFNNKQAATGNDAKLEQHAADSIASVEAFKQVYKVLMNARCMNCHPSGDVPLQGDDSHLHTMLPKRGKDGKGIYAMKCANCHQPTNTPGVHTPPGNPNWHLPPADMKMVFEGRTAYQLAKQLMDPKQNGHKNKQQLIEHADDGLVLAAWDAGEGRKPPPISHAAFKKTWITWIEKGAFAPKRK